MYDSTVRSGRHVSHAQVPVSLPKHYLGGSMKLKLPKKLTLLTN